MNDMAAFALSWLLTYLVHSSLLLGGVFLADRLGSIRSGALLSGLWRTASFGAVLTATLQVLFATSPLHGHVHMPVSQAATVQPMARDATTPMIPAESGSGKGSREDESLPLRGESHSRKPVSPAVANATRTSKPSTISNAAPWLGRSWPWLVLSAWAAGALAFLLRLGLAALAARRTLSGRRRLHDGPAVEALEALCRGAGFHQAPRLSLCTSLDGPVSLPNGEICLPSWTFEHLAPDQFRAMLAHELAHCRRHDPLWQLAGTILGALLFIQPLNRVARAGLASSAELACDDWAAMSTGDRRALAQCLFECLSQTQAGRRAVLGSAMAVAGSALTRRVGRLVNGAQRLNGKLSMKIRTGMVAALAVLAFLAPGLLVTTSRAADAPVPPASPASPASAVEAARAQTPGVDSISTRRIGHTTFISLSEQGLSVKMHADGEFAFNAAENDLASLGAGDRLEMTVTEGDSSRRVVFSNDDGKGIEHAYYVNGTSKPFDAQAREWLAGMVPEILRETALNAKTRVARILEHGGADAVLAEIGKIHSGYARSVYIPILAQSGPLEAAAVNELIALAEPIGSGYEKAQVLIGLYRAQHLEGAQLSALLEAGAGIESGYEKRQLLEAVAAKMPLDEATTQTYLGMARTIESGYEMRMALKAVLARSRLPQNVVAQVIAMAATHMHSSYELRATLASAATHIDGSDMAAKAYCQAAERIDSSYDKRMALDELVRTAKLGKAGYLCVVEAAAGISSDHDRSTLLVSVARRMPKDVALEAKYREIAKGIDSDYERRQAEDALRDRG